MSFNYQEYKEIKKLKSEIFALKCIDEKKKNLLIESIKSAESKTDIDNVVEEVNDLKIIEQLGKNSIEEFKQYNEESKLPSAKDIFALEFVPYEEKKEIMDLLKIYHDLFSVKEKLSLQDQINFRYRNLLSIKNSPEKYRRKYKRARQIDYLNYTDFINLPNISDDDLNHLIKEANDAMENKCHDYMAGVKAFKKLKYEIENDAYSAPNGFSVLRKIADSDLPKIYKEKLYSMIGDMDHDSLSSEKLDFINSAIKIPFNKTKYTIPKNFKTFCRKFRNILDEELYGMNKIKEDLITSISCKAYTSNSKYKAICLLGPPGTGKTTIARTIAQAFSIPFEQISMNTVSTGSDLTGHNYTYVGSQPGMITKALINMKCNNGVLFLDEIDKVNNDWHDSAVNTLINILDFSQNHEFVDNYFQDFKIDLSNLLIVCSANNAQNLGYILSDRIKLIYVPGYTKEEKINICHKISEKIFNELELDSGKIIIPDEIFSYLIDKDDEFNKSAGDCEKSGVRGLEHLLKHIIERIKILCFDKNMTDMSYHIPNFKLPYTLNIDHIDKFLLNYGVIGKGRMDIVEKINNSLLVKDNKQELRSMLANTNEQDSHDYPKIMNFINQALSLPFNKIKYDIPQSTKDLYLKFKNLLDQKLFGMDNAKEELITTLCCKFKNQNSKYKAIALVGPPGTGKTTIARTIADVFSVPFEQISMNTVSKGSDLTGHNYTYIGSQPGMIAKALIKMKCNNGVLFLDEIDKINSNGSDDAYNTLMSILDFSQNNEFTDNYFQNIKIDLSNLFIVCSLNDTAKLDKILADRIKFIHIEGYTKEEKIQIGFNMINKILNEFDIPKDNIIVTNDILKYLIKEVEENEKLLGKFEHGGVRGLESALKHIFERLRILIDTIGEDMNNKISYIIKDFSLPYILKTNDVDTLLKNFKTKDERCDIVKNMFL